MASTWEKLPSRQLVVIGAPGASKTSLATLLVRQLLARRERGDPVPVLLGWDPDACTSIPGWPSGWPRTTHS